MAKIGVSWIRNVVARIWPFRQDTEKTAVFEHVFLPDEGRELMKPSARGSARELREIGGEQIDEAISHFQVGEKAFHERRYREAAASYFASYETIESLSACMAWGVALMVVSELREAAGVFETGLRLAKERQVARFEAVFGINLGQVCNDLGEPDRALEALKRARNLCQEAQEPVLEAMALRHLGIVMFVQGAYDEGMRFSDCAIQIAHDSKDQMNGASALFVRGVLLTAKGLLMEAENALLEGVKCLRDIKDSYIAGLLT